MLILIPVSFSCSFKNVIIDIPIANIIAVVAVFDNHAEAIAVTKPKANKMREGLRADPFDRQYAKGKFPVELVIENPTGKNKRADKQEDQRIAEWPENLLRRGDTQHDTK